MFECLREPPPDPLRDEFPPARDEAPEGRRAGPAAPATAVPVLPFSV